MVDPATPVFGLSVSQIGRRVKATAKAAGLGTASSDTQGGLAWLRTWPPPAWTCPPS